MLKTTKWKLKNGLLAFSTLLITTVVASSNFDSFLYQTNILSYPEHQPFDGTTYPIKKTANWVGLGSEKWDNDYSDLSEAELTDLPTYNPEQLAVSVDTLKWGDPDDNKVRNAKITYSVPYMGSYQLDGNEYAGSHPAVDIKIPEATPVFAIANGTVIKASNQSSGFGVHIVLQHNNFPSLADPNEKTTIYSSYSHLSSGLVEVGDTVVKGEQIGLSGSTGTATTPHLHFQIDNDLAPWHPFWPFTWQEASDAGLDFFSAINSGLGQEKAKQTTVNPMLYVQKYFDPNAAVKEVAVSSEVSTSSASETGNDLAESYVSEKVAVVEPIEVQPAVTSDNNAGDGKVNVYKASKGSISKNGANGEFNDVPADHVYHQAIKYLANENMIQGYPDGTFRPDQAVNRVEALKFIMESVQIGIAKGELPFKDVSKEEWYADYLYTGYKLKIVNGNPDGTFKPGNTVNKAEFFKILFNGMSVDVNPNVTEAPYDDVAITDWHAPYIRYAKEIGLLNRAVTQIYPNQGMTRGEVAEAMYKLIQFMN